jgi:ABC-type Fe3+-hydroxamate transport system substrate-binding protein
VDLSQSRLSNSGNCHSKSAASIHEQMLHMMATGPYKGGKALCDDGVSSKAASYTTEGQSEDVWWQHQDHSDNEGQQQQLQASEHAALRRSVDVACLQHITPTSETTAMRRSSIQLALGESRAFGGRAALLGVDANAGSSNSSASGSSQSVGDSIISLSPAATDILLALGLRPRLAGVAEEDICIERQGWAGVDELIQEWVGGKSESRGFSRLQLLEGVPAVCHSLDGPAGLQWQVDEQAIRLARPKLVVIPGDEEHVSSSSSSSSRVSSSRRGPQVLTRTMAQRALKRTGVLWPESGAVILYHQCHSLCEVLEFMGVVADAAGVPERAVLLQERIRQRLRALASSRAAVIMPLSHLGCGHAQHLPRVVVLECITPLVASGRWVPELLQLAGGTGPHNVWGPTPGQASVEVGWSSLKQWAPEVIVVAVPRCTAASALLETPQLAMQPGWWAMPAVQSGSVYILDESLLCRPGLELVLGAEVMGHLLQPHLRTMPQAAVGRVLQLCLHDGQRCRPRLLPNYFNIYCG